MDTKQAAELARLDPSFALELEYACWLAHLKARVELLGLAARLA